MPETKSIVINTGPLLALIAAYGDLSLLERLYQHVLVPFEVCREIETGGASAFGTDEFYRAAFLERQTSPLILGRHPLSNLH